MSARARPARCCWRRPSLASLLLPLAPLRRCSRQDRDLAAAVLVELRLPRALLALAYGATLGASGAAIQALFANPLASPDLTGTTSGAALGRGRHRLSVRLRRADRACRSARWPARSARLALLLALAGPKAETATLLLAGLAISALAGALTTLALALAPSPFAFYDAYDWLMGSLIDRSLDQAAFAALPGAARPSPCCSGSARRSTGWRSARRWRSRSATTSRACGCRSSA